MYNFLMETIQLRQPDSVHWPAAVEAALRDLQTALRQMYGSQAPRLLLYGSYARGDANETSDVDVLLLYPGKVSVGNEIQRLGSILADLNLRYQVLVSVLPTSQADWQTGSTAFWNQIRQEGVSLV